jgi:hypothetical protein
MSQYVKFAHTCAVADIAAFAGLAELNTYRRKLLELQLTALTPTASASGT